MAERLIMNEFVLAEQNHKWIASQKWDVAVLPFRVTLPLASV